MTTPLNELLEPGAIERFAHASMKRPYSRELAFELVRVMLAFKPDHEDVSVVDRMLGAGLAINMYNSMASSEASKEEAATMRQLTIRVTNFAVGVELYMHQLNSPTRPLPEQVQKAIGEIGIENLPPELQEIIRAKMVH